MAKVYWIRGRSASIFHSVVAKVDALLQMQELAGLLVPDTSLAIKINLSELGYAHYLPPVVVATLFEKLRNKGLKPVITDSHSLFKGSRGDGYQWSNTALLQGFSNGETFDNQMMLAGGYTGEEGKFFPVDGEHLGGVELGSLLTDTGNILILSHVTAHPLLGLAGALYNLGLGFLTTSGKLRVHECLELVYDQQKCNDCGVCLKFCPTAALEQGPDRVLFDPRLCNNCLGCLFTCPQGAFQVRPEGVPIYQQSIVEAALAAKSSLRKGGFFVNFLNSVTPQTDEFPFSDAPFLPDLGILASPDPVALDWATFHMIIRSPGLPGSLAQDLEVMNKGDDKLLAITGQSPESMLQYAEKMNLGTREIELLTGA